jgi:hypothetical protein
VGVVTAVVGVPVLGMAAVVASLVLRMARVSLVMMAALIVIVRFLASGRRFRGVAFLRVLLRRIHASSHSASANQRRGSRTIAMAS